eukprot:scaffold115308_cov69-Phaeocystis_antarctica.AAC.1
MAAHWRLVLPRANGDPPGGDQAAELTDGHSGACRHTCSAGRLPCAASGQGEPAGDEARSSRTFASRAIEQVFRILRPVRRLVILPPPPTHLPITDFHFGSVTCRALILRRAPCWRCARAQSSQLSSCPKHHTSRGAERVSSASSGAWDCLSAFGGDSDDDEPESWSDRQPDSPQSTQDEASGSHTAQIE